LRLRAAAKPLAAAFYGVDGDLLGEWWDVGECEGDLECRLLVDHLASPVARVTLGEA
jgi:hypothetical protein